MCSEQDFDKCYKQLILQNSKPFKCPDCEMDVMLVDYERHCSNLHNFDIAVGCVWCKIIQWDTPNESLRRKHIISCFKKFYNSFFETGLRYLNLQDGVVKKIPKNWNHLNKKVYIPYKLPDNFPKVFRANGINLAHGYVREYLQMKDVTSWQHISLNETAFDSYVKVILLDKNCTQMLRFFCWCNAGNCSKRKDSFQPHRHMIVVSPKNHFEENVWPLLTVSKTDSNKHYNKFKEIFSAMELLDTLEYLTRPKSNCPFFPNEPSNSQNPPNFYLDKILPADFKIPLVTCWKGGLYKLLEQDYFQHIPSSHIRKHKTDWSWNRGWHQQLKHVPDLPKNLVWPVRKVLKPVLVHDDDPSMGSPYFFYLLGNLRLRFEISVSLQAMEHEQWLKVQAEGGNKFFDNVEEETYKISPEQAKEMLALNNIEAKKISVQKIQEPLKMSDESLLECGLEPDFDLKKYRVDDWTLMLKEILENEKEHETQYQVGDSSKNGKIEPKKSKKQLKNAKEKRNWAIILEEIFENAKKCETELPKGDASENAKNHEIESNKETEGGCSDSSKRGEIMPENPNKKLKSAIEERNNVNLNNNYQINCWNLLLPDDCNVSEYEID